MSLISASRCRRGAANFGDYGGNARRLDTIRHSTADLMAQALKRLYPGRNSPSGRRSKTGSIMTSNVRYRLLRMIFHIEAEMKKIQSENLPIGENRFQKQTPSSSSRKAGNALNSNCSKDLKTVRSPYTDRASLSTCAGPARSEHRTAQAFQAAFRCGCVLAG